MSSSRTTAEESSYKITLIIVTFLILHSVFFKHNPTTMWRLFDSPLQHGAAVIMFRLSYVQPQEIKEKSLPTHTVSAAPSPFMNMSRNLEQGAAFIILVLIPNVANLLIWQDFTAASTTFWWLPDDLLQLCDTSSGDILMLLFNTSINVWMNPGTSVRCSSSTRVALWAWNPLTADCLFHKEPH